MVFFYPVPEGHINNALLCVICFWCLSTIPPRFVVSIHNFLGDPLCDNYLLE